MTTITDVPGGYVVLPPGRLANAVTWLEMRARPAGPLAPPLRLQPVAEPGHDAYRLLFARVGRPWLWSRAYAPAAPIPPEAHVGVDDAGQPVGVVEFATAARDVEIAFFGLVPEGVGRGLGRRLMAAALDRAWMSAGRVWLHTCSFDHPAALRFYRSCGFVPYASGFEVMDDPRLTGGLGRDEAPHVPLLGKGPTPG